MSVRGQRWARAAAGPALVVGLAGCVGVHDEARPAVQVENESNDAVVVRIAGASDSWTIDVAAGAGAPLVVTDDCLGTALVVESEDGEPVGRVEEPACPGRLLTIAQDGSLTYVEEG